MTFYQQTDKKVTKKKEETFQMCSYCLKLLTPLLQIQGKLNMTVETTDEHPFISQ